MRLTRTVTLVTANVGRGVNEAEFRENVRRLKQRTPGKNRFFQFQEVDEADTPAELKYIREIFGKTHRFVGTKTHVPIAVPKTFEIDRKIVTVASEGVDRLSPRRHVVQAVVHPKDHEDRLVVATNTHFAREAPALARVRTEAEYALRGRLRIDLPSWLTADLNSQNYRPLGLNEQRLVTSRLDYIRAYERAGVKFRLINTGSINLTIDGHNAHWARVQIIWP